MAASLSQMTICNIHITSVPCGNAVMHAILLLQWDFRRKMPDNNNL